MKITVNAASKAWTQFDVIFDRQYSCQCEDVEVNIYGKSVAVLKLGVD